MTGEVDKTVDMSCGMSMPLCMMTITFIMCVGTAHKKFQTNSTKNKPSFAGTRALCPSEVKYTKVKEKTGD